MNSLCENAKSYDYPEEKQNRRLALSDNHDDGTKWNSSKENEPQMCISVNASQKMLNIELKKSWDM